MPNEENLMPIEVVNSRRTRKQHSEDSRRAGIASGKARRAKKNMKELAKLLLDLEASEKSKQSLKQVGVPEEDCSNKMNLVVSMYMNALKGNMRAAELIMDLIGEAPQKGAPIPNKDEAELSALYNALEGDDDA